MKSSIRMLTIIILIAMLVSITGCAKTSDMESPKDTDTEPSKSRQHLSIGTAGTGGYFYPLGGAIADIINRFVDGAEATAEVTGGSAENVVLVGTNEVQIGMANGNLIYAGYHGKEPYDQKYDQLRGLFTIQPSVIQLVTLEKTGINTITDLKGKKVVLGPAGGGQIVLFNECIKHYGMSIDDFEGIYIAFTEGVNELIDGNVDAMVAMAAVPQAAVMELAARSSFKIIEIDEDIIKKIVSESPYFVRFVIPGVTYSGLNEDAVTIAATSGIFGRADMDEDLAYDICKAVYSNLDILINTVESAKVMSIENGKDLPIPLHPGAERFFKEQGVL